MNPHGLEAAWRDLAQSGPRSPGQWGTLSLLTPASWLYRLLSAGKRTWYWSVPGTQTRIPAKVVSIGNLTVGGSGKTPLAALVARTAARNLGLRTAILTRGYRARHLRWVTRAATGGELLVPPEEIGDEGILLAEKVPEATLWVAKRRALAAREAVERDDAEVLVLDDALQYWRLARDADLVALDATCPFGNGRIFPAGLLREPPSSLRRAAALVLRQPSPDAALDPPEVRAAAPDVPRYLGRYRYTHWRTPGGVVVDLAEGARRVRSACAGIARPDLFFSAVEALTGRALPQTPRPDHHRYSDGELEALPHPIAMTEKDGTNLPEGFRRDDRALLLVAEYEVVPLEGAPPFQDLLRDILCKVEG